MPQTHFIHFYIPPSEWGKKKKYARFPKQGVVIEAAEVERTVKFSAGIFSSRSAGYHEHTIYHLHSRTDQKGFVVLHNVQPFLGFVFSVRGRAIMELEESAKVSMNDQSWFLLYLPGPRYLIHLPKGVTDTMIVFLSPKNVADLKELTGERRLPVPYPPANWRRKAWTLHHKFINKELGESLRFLSSLKNIGFRSALEVDRAVDGFILQYSLAVGTEPPEDKTRPHFGREAAQLAVNYIRKYYTEPGCGKLKEFSRMFNVSEKTMRNEFLALTGLSLPEFVRNERMEKAATLIEEGMRTVNEVAEAVGYTAASNFTRDFGLKYKVSPGEQIKRQSLRR